MKDLIYWIWLSLSCTIDTGTFSKLMGRFSDAKAVYDASEREIADCIGYKTSDRSALANKDLSRAAEIYDFCTLHKVGMLKYSDKEYPELLRKTATPPVLLYYRGKLPDFNSGLFVAAVGTRELSEYGRKNAFNICYDLATAGATVVSGMALGIDGVALAGALAAEKPTVAILGSGIDVCYPSQHLTLAKEIVKRGCILTEYPPKTKPNKYNFPKRNRIISGLCSATLVVEGRERSGALITARYAEEQGRAVFAIPGNIGSEHSELTNLLLKKNAKPATRAEDILLPFEKEFGSSINLFLLEDRRKIDMMYVLRTLEVVANCPSDDIYNQPWIIKRIPRASAVNVEDEVSDRGKETVKEADKSIPTKAEIGAKNHPISTEPAPSQYQRPSHIVDMRFSTYDDLHVNHATAGIVHSTMPAYLRGDELSSIGDRPSHHAEDSTDIKNISSFGFDAETLKIYKKIPPGGAVEIEDLTTEKMPMRTVMKYLTRLEAGKFIVILPGGKVMRKY